MSDQEPVESQEDWDRAIKAHAHRAVLTKDSPFRELRQWECEVCGDPMYEVEAEVPWYDR